MLRSALRHSTRSLPHAVRVRMHCCLRVCCRAAAASGALLRRRAAASPSRRPPPVALAGRTRTQLDDALRARVLTVDRPARRTGSPASSTPAIPRRAGQRVRAGARRRRPARSSISRRSRSPASQPVQPPPAGVRRDRSPGRLGDARRRQRRADAAAGRSRAPAQQRDVDGRVSRGGGDAPALRRLLEPRRAPPLGGSTRDARRRGAGGARPSSRPPTAPRSRRMSPTRSRHCAAMRRAHADGVRAGVQCGGNGGGAARGDVVAARGGRPPGRAQRRRRAAAGGRAAAPRRCAAPRLRVRGGRRSGRARRSSRPIAAVRARAVAAVGGAARAGRATGRSRGVRACRGALRRADAARTTRRAPGRSRRLHRRRREHAAGDAPAAVRLPSASGTARPAPCCPGSTRRSGWIAAPSMTAPSRNCV